jgi:hypothetical protein
MRPHSTAAAYVRVSSKAQDDASQRAALERAAAARGHSVGAWYAEKKTAKTLDRAELGRLREDARAGKIARLYLFRLDGLARSGIRDTFEVVKGELLALRKEDIDLTGGTITVQRSYAADTTKGGHADVIPIAEPVRPYLAAAMQASRSGLVFPREDGTMHSRDVALDHVLRRALGRAGVVVGYTTCVVAGVWVLIARAARGARSLPEVSVPPLVEGDPAARPLARPAPHRGDPAPQGRSPASVRPAHPPAPGPEAHGDDLRPPRRGGPAQGDGAVPGDAPAAAAGRAPLACRTVRVARAGRRRCRSAAGCPCGCRDGR